MRAAMVGGTGYAVAKGRSRAERETERTHSSRGPSSRRPGASGTVGAGRARLRRVGPRSGRTR